MLSGRWCVGSLAVCAAMVAVWTGPLGPALIASRSVVAVSPPTIATATLGAAPADVRIPRSFLGLSMEYVGFAHDGAAGPLLARLVGGLASGGGPPMLRIGGRTSDASWWNPAHWPRPAGISFDITPQWVARLSALVRASGADVLLALNLAAGRPALAVAWARAAARGLPAGELMGFEIGNEPDLYGHIAWYRTTKPGELLASPARGRRYARGPHYDVPRFTAEFLRYVAAVRSAVPWASFTGPGFSTPRWMPNLRRFLDASSGALVAATYHRYPLRTCHRPPQTATIPHLLNVRSSRGLAHELAPYVAQAHRRDFPFWVDEFNSVACGGRRGVSDTFASALWGLDTLFELALAGVDRVDVHSRPDTSYSPFKLSRAHGRWVAHVAPLYDALRLFAQLTPAPTRLARIRTSSRFDVTAWALAGPRRGLRIVVIDKDPRARGLMRVRIPPQGHAQLVRLDAPALGARSAVLAGQAYGADGLLHGARSVEWLQPDRHGYLLALRRPGIAIITLRGSIGATP
ncbi:MAG TPA: hypothetical protein VFF79_03400 [Conexibacter sp.]|nr:hypothetical protein [Conexibacter sp.]